MRGTALVSCAALLFLSALPVSAGQIRFGARVINDDHHYGVLSFTDVIVKSSNVGAIKVG